MRTYDRVTAQLTFLYHSLQDVHVILLCHTAERGELGLGDKLQKLKKKAKKKKKRKKKELVRNKQH